MKTKNFFAAMCGVFLLAGATIATYTAVTKSQKKKSDTSKHWYNQHAREVNSKKNVMTPIPII